MIRNILLSTVALAALTTTAFAADLPSRRMPPVYVPPPIPVFSWTGFYAGGQVGYGFGRDTLGFTTPAAVVGVGAVGAQPHGVLGGGHIGYNFAGFPGAGFIPGFGALGTSGLVFGVEGDVDGSDYRDTFAVGGAAAQLRNNIQGSARGRVGIAVDRALFYATGGAAFAEFKETYTAPGLGFASPSHTRVGYTVGGGIEYAITTQWSLRAEYRYSDFGTFTDAPAAGFAFRRREILERAQVGFSYKFDSIAPIPVVARY